MAAKITRLDEARARLRGRLPVRRVGRELASPLEAALRAVAACPDKGFLYKTRLFQEVFQAELARRANGGSAPE